MEVLEMKRKFALLLAIIMAAMIILPACGSKPASGETLNVNVGLILTLLILRLTHQLTVLQ